MSDKSEDSCYSIYQLLMFLIFAVMGIGGAYRELNILYLAFISGSIDQLTFEFIKYDSGTVTYGYAALIQHLAVLFAAFLFLGLAFYAFKAMVHCMEQHK